MISIHSLYGFLLGKVAQKIAEESKPLLDEYGLSLKQFGTLAVVYEYPEASQKEIGNMQKIDRTSCGQIIDQLQSKGYLIRLQCETNRKANVIRLTESGKACIESLWTDKIACEHKVLSCLSNSEKSELLRILKKVIGGMANE
jgi:MarR family 2-MHQ and catechol resistance regulon transcriptional repressor